MRLAGRGTVASAIGVVMAAVLLVAAGGCSAESTRIAIEAQSRADQEQAAVFERQHEALCVLLYRDLLRRLEHAGAPLSDGQRAAVNEVWNERDLIEFWRVQHERANALRLLGVDAKLYGDQSVADLLFKSLETRTQRVAQALVAGRAAGE